MNNSRRPSESIHEEITEVAAPKWYQCYSRCDWFTTNQNLVMVKVIYFCFYGALACLLPYLNLHMLTIQGITEEKLTTVVFMIPLITFFIPPIAGYVVDKVEKFKIMIMAFLILTAVFYHSLFLLSEYGNKGEISSFILSDGDKVQVWWDQCAWAECPQGEIGVVVESCEKTCMNGTDFPFDREINVTVEMFPNLSHPPPNSVGFAMEGIIATSNQTTIQGESEKFGISSTDIPNFRCGGNATSTQLNLTACPLIKCFIKFNDTGSWGCDTTFSSDSQFTTYIVLRIIGACMLVTVITMLDPLALFLIETYAGDFGKQRLFSCLGMAVFGPLIIWKISSNTKTLGYVDFSTAFYSFDVLLVTSAAAIFLLPDHILSPSTDTVKRMGPILKRPSALVLLMALFVLGMCWGFIERGIWHTLDKQEPDLFVGWITIVRTVTSVPLLFMAEKIGKKIGSGNIFLLAFLAYGIRILGYYFVRSKWWCIPLEALESTTLHLLWVVAINYSTTIVPSDLSGTFIGLMSMSHNVLGRGFGGVIWEEFHFPVTILMGIVAIVAGIVYSILDRLWFKKKERLED